MPDLRLDHLIVAHQLAVEGFRQAMRDSRDSVEEDRAYENEASALRALLSFPPTSIEDARARASYLVTTRFFNELDEDGRAYLCSFLPPPKPPA